MKRIYNGKSTFAISGQQLASWNILGFFKHLEQVSAPTVSSRPIFRKMFAFARSTQAHLLLSPSFLLIKALWLNTRLNKNVLYMRHISDLKISVRRNTFDSFHFIHYAFFTRDNMSTEFWWKNKYRCQPNHLISLANYFLFPRFKIPAKGNRLLWRDSNRTSRRGERTQGNSDSRSPGIYPHIGWSYPRRCINVDFA